MVTLIGMGAGLPGSLTAEGLAALQQADLILGARRLLEHLPDGCTEHRKALYKPEEILACLAQHPEGDTALLYSGDTGFYSGASGLLPMLRACGISCRVLPGLSSVQLLAAAVGRPWQDWKLVSAHGCACDPVAECLTARGLTAEVTQIAVSRTKPAGRLHLLMANNPIFLITGERK